MTATMDRPRIYRATTLQMVARAASDTLPAGVIGQVEGIALVYDVVDSFRTTFAKGCLTRTVRERVAAGKVRLFLDHGDMPTKGMYDTHLHIGVVRSVRDTVLDDGTHAALFQADIFDTEPGRDAHEYLRAIAATASETGVSIGMMDMPKTTRAVVNGQPCERIHEVALREISITSVSSVPGTRVTTVRGDLQGADTAPSPGDASATPDSDATDGTPAADSDADASDSQPAKERVDLATHAERLAFCRAALKRLYD
jgi:phage head maturation protease